ncbi:MAG: hypothetical protein F6K58_17445 [Symploca sp. SIO2E9]|nr:hypothetical protein [Symploca sp. SIO2E9]
MSTGSICIIGGGMDFTAHLTVEACKAIRESQTIFHSGCHDNVRLWLEALGGDAKILNIDEGYYQIGQFRPDMYKSMADQIVAEATCNRKVVLIEPGSAMVTDLVTFYTIGLAEKAGITTHIISGISSLEQIFLTFGIDPSSGLQIILAQELVACNVTLNPHLDSIILQPGYYDTLWSAGWAKSTNQRYDSLITSLKRSFSKNQRMALIRLATHPEDINHELWFLLNDFAYLHSVLTPLHSLFIPAIPSTNKNSDFQQRIHSWETTLSFLELTKDGLPYQLQFNLVSNNRDLDKACTHLPEDIQERAVSLSEAWKRERRERISARLLV